MALTITYNTGSILLSDVYRASSGGTVFSANLGRLSSYDLFDDTAVVDDAIYFCEAIYRVPRSDLQFSISTPLVATSIELAWEYYHRDNGWVPIEDLLDETNSFQNSGSVKVRYPAQWSPGFITINGQANRGWARCRIVSVSGLTEGGAVNARTRQYDGIVNVSGTDDTTPATFEDVYQWLLANEPHISISKRNNVSYNFTKVGISMNSTFRTRREIVELGSNVTNNASAVQTRPNYLWAGDKLSETQGSNGSTFIVHGGSNTSVFSPTLSAPIPRVYGSTIKTPTYLLGVVGLNYSGYLKLTGEWIDNDVEMSVKVPEVTDTISNMRISASLVIVSTEIGKFDNVKYICNGSFFIYVYRAGFELNGLDWAFTGSGSFFYIYNTVGNEATYYWDIIDPITPLPTMSTNPKIIAISVNSTNNYTKAIYESPSGDIDITTKTNNHTSGQEYDLSGEIGECYYYGYTNQNQMLDGFGFNLENLNSANDGYEYVFEHYRGSGTGWVEVEEVFDGTKNFTETGQIFFITPTGYGEHSLFGTTASWIRIRITKKGTTPPTISRMRKARCSAQNRWVARERYSVDICIQDSNGDNIEGAEVILYTDGTEEFTEITDVNGEISNKLTAKEWHFDPVNNKSTLISENITVTSSIKISKAGYETYYSKINPIKLDTVIALKKAVPLMIDSNGEAHIRFNKENIGNNRELIG